MIPSLYQFLKPLKRIPKKDVIITIIIVLVGTASFALGKLSGVFYSREPLKIEYGDTLRAESLPTSQAATVIQATTSLTSETAVNPVSPTNSVPGSGEAVVAAKKGQKYHFPWCSGAKQISEANKVWFTSAEEARKAGYEPAANCKGLK